MFNLTDFVLITKSVIKCSRDMMRVNSITGKIALLTSQFFQKLTYSVIRTEFLQNVLLFVTTVIFSIKNRLGRIFTLKVGPWHENIFCEQIELLENEKVLVLVKSFKNKNKIEYNWRPSRDSSKI